MDGLEISEIGFSYGRKRALDRVSFRVEPGAFCALLGPNGAGKSTLFGLLTRLFTTQEGTIHVAGHDLDSICRVADPSGPMVVYSTLPVRPVVALG